MIRTYKTFNFVACLALLSAAPAFTQTQSAEATPETTASPVAHVYVQTTNGINVFDATSAGSLTLVKGSPFSTTGQMEGINGAYLLSVGTDDLHSYKIESTGTVGPQVSQINTQSYGGAECGNTAGAGAVLDHTGHYFFVQLYGASYNGGEDYACAAWQTYKVETNGEFTFLGYNELGYGFDSTSLDSTVPTISSNDKFTYGVYYTAFAPVYAPFKLSSNGVLEANSNFTYNNPTADPSPSGSDNNYFPTSMAADPAGHVAISMVESFATPYPGPPAQLASFTISSNGSLTTTNTYADMPILWGNVSTTEAFNLRMSPGGNLLAVGGYPGLQIFHFNGAAPITKYSAVLLPAVQIDQLAWDNNNHLYALSYETGELYVYTVTLTSISEVSGSPYSIKDAYGLKGLIVVPKL